MQAVTSPREILCPIGWRLLLPAICVLVFVFALHAKLAVYHQSSQPQTSTSDKLWLNGEKATVPPIFPGIGGMWSAALVVWLFPQSPEMRPAVIDRAPAVIRAQQVFLYRFLHSPPVG